MKKRILELQQDCLHEVFEFLDARDLCRCASVCRDFQRLAECETLWERLYEKSFLGPTVANKLATVEWFVSFHAKVFSIAAGKPVSPRTMIKKGITIHHPKLEYKKALIGRSERKDREEKARIDSLRRRKLEKRDSRFLWSLTSWNRKRIVRYLLRFSNANAFFYLLPVLFAIALTIPAVIIDEHQQRSPSWTFAFIPLWIGIVLSWIPIISSCTYARCQRLSNGYVPSYDPGHVLHRSLTSDDGIVMMVMAYLSGNRHTHTNIRRVRFSYAHLVSCYFFFTCFIFVLPLKLDDALDSDWFVSMTPLWFLCALLWLAPLAQWRVASWKPGWLIKISTVVYMHAFALAFFALITGLSIADGHGTFAIETTFALLFTADLLIILWCIAWSAILWTIRIREYRQNSPSTPTTSRRQDRPPHAVQPYNTQTFMRHRGEHAVSGFSLHRRRNMRAQTPLFLCLLLCPLIFSEILACIRICGHVNIPHLTVLSPIISSFVLAQLVILINVCSSL